MIILASYPPAGRLYIEWLNSVKKEEPLPGRMGKIIEASEQTSNPGMM